MSENKNISLPVTPPREAAPVTLWDKIYRFEYGLGLNVVRLARRIWRLPARRRLASTLRAAWQSAVTRPLNRKWRKLRRLFAGSPEARRELAETARTRPFALIPCLFRQLGQEIRRNREDLLGLLRLVGPVAATAVLIATIAVWTQTDFCLSLTYRGQELGYIDSENVYTSAAGMALDRVVNVDNSFSVEAVPELSITLQGNKRVLSDTELCDAILRTAGDSIAEATGLYVNDQFIGAMESDSELNALLEKIKDGYYNKNDKNQRAEFIQNVQTVEGLFPALSVVDGTAMSGKLTAEAVVKKTYTVQAGDTLSTIARRNNMTVSDLRGMNPAYASTDMVRIGDELVVQRPQPFLQVKVIKTLSYTEKIDYATQYVNNTKKPVTYSAVKTKGVEGSRDIVAEVTYIDGVETGRKIISSVVTKQPVTKVVERGTMKVTSSGGTEVVIGDGVSTGSMLWPVPICHSMSQRYHRGHSGIDIANGPVRVFNQPAVAADGGKVIYAGWYYGYGNFVKIQHANGLVTAYAHLNSIAVVNGQTVSRGQMVGRIGSTGRSSGPHLHFEVYKNGVRVNPLNYVKP